MLNSHVDETAGSRRPHVAASRMLRLGAACLTLGLGVTACASGGGGGGGGGNGEEGGAVESLSVWHLSCDTPEILQAYEGYEEETGVQIELVDIPCSDFETTTTTKWGSGDRPDILEYHASPSLYLPLNPAETMQDLSDMEFVDASTATVSVDGKTFGAITHFAETFGIYYNKQVLEDNGLEAPASFDDLFAMCEALQGSGVAPIFEGGTGPFTQLLPAFYAGESNVGAEYTDAVLAKEVELNDPEGPFVESLQAYADLRDADCFNADATSATIEDQVAAVVKGEAAMTALHSNMYGALLEAGGGDAEELNATLGFTGVSATEAIAVSNYGPFGTFYAPKTGDAAKEQAARDFIAWVTGDGYQAMVDAGPLFPVIDTATAPEGFSELQMSFKEAGDNASPTIFGDLPGFGAFAQATQKLLAGQSDPQQTADEMAGHLAQAAQAAGLQGW